MNISTGGPHILLFERDQQLATLLISEFQLAGYECHTARTAVEVFDAIARYPIRLVLVNLAQAAAARREFWVALDAQRRGRGVQVLTFHCTNLAGYGPQDPDERSQGMVADMEIDGMLGLMNLANAVRTRVPNAASVVNTIPRVPKAASPPTPRPANLQPAQANPPLSNGGVRTIPSTENLAYQSPARGNNPSPTAQAAPSVPPPVPPPASPVPLTTTTGAANLHPTSYTEKIRAVLYPNQRTWSSSPVNTLTSLSEQKIPYNTPEGASRAQSGGPSTTDISMLQRLANPQAWHDEQRESGLAQLSRLVQEHQSPATQEKNKGPVQPGPEIQVQRAQTSRSNVTLDREAGGMASHVMPPTPRPTPLNDSLVAQPLRASPIQDLPERSNGSSLEVEGGRRSDNLSRPGQSSNHQVTPISALSSKPAPPAPQPVVAKAASVHEDAYTTRETQEAVTSTEVQEADNQGKTPLEQAQIEVQKVLGQGVDTEASAATNNAMLLDIMQSLPPMPSPPPAQAIQAQILNGRATRSLGSVLLAGHLVPENRLEVAQNIQRMLRGVDLNYQLGEILLMFKLLTPDQLLAASLVSYGLITTTQISALGRIRQELHSIGLEYDLESLLILFRILTPEQLREVKSGWQG